MAAALGRMDEVVTERGVMGVVGGGGRIDGGGAKIGTLMWLDRVGPGRPLEIGS
jgi:hypothetical protein